MINEEELENFIFIQALENAVSFDGKANPKALLGKVIPKFPDVKKDMQHYINTIENIVEQVNGLGFEKQKKKLTELNPKFFEKTEKKETRRKDELPDLPNVGKKIRVRTEPAPSGYLHIGHAYNIVFNYEYVKKYGGEFILRIADTNPENISKDNYDKIIEDVRWLTDDGVNEIYYQSDRLELYYKYLERLIKEGMAYVCECDSETFKSFIDNSSPCPHRDIPADEQMKRYEAMQNGKYKDGEAVIRFKANLEDKNPALRDFPIARLNSNPHARVGTKYKLWPLMNLSVAVDDIEMELTHIIRGKDHEINMHRQMMIHKALGMKSPEYYHIGRVRFEDIILSKTELSELIENKTYESWEDPRVPSLISYRKRGYQAAAFRKMILMGGISKRDSRITSEEYHKNLNFFNKEILEEKSDRFFFIHNSKKVKILNLEDIKEKKIMLPKHPDHPERGHREFELRHEFLIDGFDFNNLEKDDLVRLMHLANFKVKKKEKDTLELEFVSKDFDRRLNLKRNIHFLPVEENHKCIMILSDNSRLNGLCEELGNIKEDTTVQFERFGFSRFDSKKGEEYVFYFTHR